MTDEAGENGQSWPEPGDTGGMREVGEFRALGPQVSQPP
jgi:hypothetical protein